MSRSTKLRWVNKVMRSKYFVVLTDKESIISLSGTQPDRIEDVIMLNEQAVALQSFRYKLDELIAEHERLVNRLMGVKDVPKKVTPKKRPAQKSRKVKSIKVQEK